MQGPLILLILDGWGLAPKTRGNAVEQAKKPNFDKLWKKYPRTQLKAHGKYVGLPKGYVGNSEAGHINIGAGRVVVDDAVLISQDIKTGRFQRNMALEQTVNFVLEKKSALHLMGLVSEGQSPHAVLKHLYALVDLAASRGVEKIYLHLFTDGRDAPQYASLDIIEQIMKKIGNKAELVSLIGRFYAMDRGRNWQRTKKAYECFTEAKGQVFSDYKKAVLHAYNKKVTDEYVQPSLIGKSLKEIKDTRIKEKDGVIFFNARSDRARQLTKCFVQPNFNQRNKKAFKRGKVYKNLKFCALTDFGPDLDDILTAYPGTKLKNTMPAVLENIKQLYAAESEKYAHVTFFINGGSDVPVNGEDRLKVDSPKLKSYAQKPEMSIYKLTDKISSFLNKDKYDFYTINFANPDMVGHTGDLKSTIEAVEHVDKCLGELVDLALSKKGGIMVTADHGNAEEMLNPKTKEIWTGHTTNPVPFILVGEEFKKYKLKKGSLVNIAPTVYELLNMTIKKPEVSDSLIIK